MAHDRVRNSRGRKGFVLVTLMVSLVVLLAFLGLSVDVGYMEYQKTRMQTAADAAALGGVQEIKLAGSATAVAAAKTDAALNGFTDGRNSASVSVANPPSSGYYTSDSTAVEVMISQSVSTYFMRLVGSPTITVRARAVARRGAGTNCLYALEPTASGAFSASGGINVQVGCGVVVNSSSGTAMSVSGGATVAATSFGVVGDYSISGGSMVTPTPIAHVASETDPLSYVPAPTVGSCDHTNYSVSGGATAVANPGVYCKGISISGGSRLTFNPGTYILKGGGFSVSGGSTATGAGVTFYNTAAAGNPYAPISISGGTTISLSAPTTGPLAAMLFFQDRSIVSASANSISGGASTVLNGALYFSTSPVTYSGGTAGTYTIIVARNVSFSGGSALNANYTSLPGGSPIKGGAALSE